MRASTANNSRRIEVTTEVASYPTVLQLAHTKPRKHKPSTALREGMVTIMCRLLKPATTALQVPLMEADMCRPSSRLQGVSKEALDQQLRSTPDTFRQVTMPCPVRDKPQHTRVKPLRTKAIRLREVSLHNPTAMGHRRTVLLPRMNPHQPSR